MFIAVVAGVKSEIANYGLSTFPQVEIIGRSRLMFPGNHARFNMEPKVFSKALLEAFEIIESKKKNKDIQI